MFGRLELPTIAPEQSVAADINTAQQSAPARRGIAAVQKLKTAFRRLFPDKGLACVTCDATTRRISIKNQDQDGRESTSLLGFSSARIDSFHSSRWLCFRNRFTCARLSVSSANGNGAGCEIRLANRLFNRETTPGSE
jgi:hypothetical protein